MGHEDRAKVLFRMADLLDARADDFAIREAMMLIVHLAYVPGYGPVVSFAAAATPAADLSTRGRRTAVPSPPLPMLHLA